MTGEAGKICAGCDAALAKSYTLGERTLPSGAVIVVGICEECYHTGHQTRRRLAALNRRVGKNLAANLERYRVQP
jgi:hypothetical protein